MRQRLFFGIATLVGLFVFTADAAPSPSSSAEKDIALVLKVKGEAQVKLNSRPWQSLQKGSRLSSGTEIRTGHDALVALVFTDDKSMMKIRQDSQVLLKGQRDQNQIRKQIAVDLGAIWARITPGGAGFRMETPSGVAAVKGTEFYGIVGPDGVTIIIGIRGLIELFNETGSVLVGAGQTGTATKDQIPELQMTQQLDNWAEEDNLVRELEIEFQNEKSETKTLKIRYREVDR
ncbi:FecR domain-containing protein [candidate division KSB1 bacterium]|nr:FecR domain-containing protein [candidate division KSB1 bacterium]